MTSAAEPRRGRTLGTLVLLVAAALATGCGGSDPTVTHVGETMGTTYTVRYHGADVAKADAARAIEATLDDINAALSTYDPSSEISRLNARDTAGWYDVSTHFVVVARAARDVFAVSGGAFDPSVGPLVDLWGFGARDVPTTVPDEAAIEAARALVGYDRIEIDAEAGRIHRPGGDYRLDYSAIAKGYGVDTVADALAALGIGAMMVEIGGEVRTMGRNAVGLPWQIAIEEPVPGQRTIRSVVGLSDVGLATSGDYRNYFEKDGTRYSHTIDPTTGRPIRHRLASVSVVHASAMMADAWATALMVAGPERGAALAEAAGLDTMFVVRDDDGFQSRFTGGFEARLSRPVAP